MAIGTMELERELAQSKLVAAQESKQGGAGCTCGLAAKVG